MYTLSRVFLPDRASHPISLNRLLQGPQLASKPLNVFSSDRSSYSDDGQLCIYPSKPLFQIFTQSIDAIDVTSDTLSCLSCINAIDVK